MKLLTQKQYAKRQGVTPQYVNKLVSQGKIVLRAGKVDPRQADAALQSWARAGARPAKRKAAAKKAGQASAKKRQSRPPKVVVVETGSATPRRGSASSSLTAWRAVTEEMKAKTAELDYKRAIGELLPKSEVLEAERWKNANIRTRFRKLARSLAPRMARVGSASEAEAVLIEEIDLQLAELAEDPLGVAPVLPAAVEAPLVAPVSAPSIEGSVVTQ